MRAAAVVLTYGRPELAELLAQWSRQRERVPLLVWVDGTPELAIAAPAGVHVLHGPRFGARESIGLIRAAAMHAAIGVFALTAADALIVLDDDDYYAPDHTTASLDPLRQGARWTGARAMGLETERGVEYVRADRGCGQHATWALTVGAYLSAGGYGDAKYEDMDLALRLGWGSCMPHYRCTHVRRQYEQGDNFSGARVRFDRARLREISGGTRAIVPYWSPRCQTLASWCAAQP